MFRWLGKGVYTKRLKHSLFFFSLLFNLLFLIFLFFFCLFTISYFTNMVFIMYVTKKKRRKMWNRRTREMKRKASDFVNKIRRTGDTIWSNYKEHLLLQSKDFYRNSLGTKKNSRIKLITFMQINLSEISKAV